MVRKNSDLNIETKPAPFGGTGKITVRNLLNGPDEMYNILSGTGRYNDNGSIVDVHPGDVYFCEDGESHSY